MSGGYNRSTLRPDSFVVRQALLVGRGASDSRSHRRRFEVPALPEARSRYASRAIPVAIGGEEGPWPLRRIASRSTRSSSRRVRAREHPRPLARSDVHHPDVGFIDRLVLDHGDSLVVRREHEIAPTGSRQRGELSSLCRERIEQREIQRGILALPGLVEIVGGHQQPIARRRDRANLVLAIRVGEQDRVVSSGGKLEEL